VPGPQARSLQQGAGVLPQLVGLALKPGRFAFAAAQRVNRVGVWILLQQNPWVAEPLRHSDHL
jgi:hypothetical protein